MKALIKIWINGYKVAKKWNKIYKKKRKKVDKIFKNNFNKAIQHEKKNAYRKS